MKIALAQIKLQILVVFVLAASVVSVFSQETVRKSKYVSEKYKVAFQMPESSSKNADSTEELVIFLGETDKFGLAARLEFIVEEQQESEQLSQLLASDEGAKIFTQAFVDEFKAQGKKNGVEVIVLETNRLQIGGFNSLKLVTSADMPGVKVRTVTFVIPVPQHKRMYTFVVAGPDKDFDKWLTAAEVSVKSFALIKAKGK